MLLPLFSRCLGLLATLCCAATIQQPSLLHLDHNNGNNSSSNNDRLILPADTLSFVPMDPRFSIDLFTLHYDISDRSVYMTGLRAMRDLSRLPFDGLVAGGSSRWSDARYGEVEIALLGLDANLKAKHAMWSIYQAMLAMGREDQFRAMRGTIYWRTEPGQPRNEIGKLLVVKGSSVRVPGLPLLPVEEDSVRNGTHHASSVNTRDVAIPPHAGRRPESNATTTTTTSKNDTTTSLQVRRTRNVRVEFEGPTLNKLGVFICIYGAIVGAASAPHPSADFHHASLNDEQTRVELDFKLWSDPQRRVSPRLEIDDIVFMLYSIPRYMYDNNKFRAGQFVFLVNDVPLLEGSMKKYL